MEDLQLAEELLERVRKGEDRVLGSEQMWQELEG